ncbi:MAG: hypothetical protein JNK51_02910 [Blastocatellia bacterium]|nr:hypothetical protein [Chloracidobacterium sp.]MBL8183851.1 hypothetical protein [Blastocatellia bacterium]HBE82391.1 hypothetical protein [Blastocatellia bacterium]HRJ89402.1 hypothetical protein [Pyrinomonadaceae bacterium]HRK51732.1 hypothetical protein [Pyrinomonadaceae bacterium]
MVFRAIALSIALLIGIGTLIPLATEYAEAGPKKTRKYKKKREWRGVKKYSKRWWQLYRAQERRKRAVAARRRALRLRQMRLARARQAAQNNATAAVRSKPAQTEKPPAAVLPSGQAAPKNWAPGQSTDGEVQFRVAGNSGMEVGSASISVVGPATGETVATGRNRSVGGVPTTSLRREVINRMIRENGWVVNDYQKEIGGKTVYVVVAQSQANGGRVQSRLFYFTEADGRIYSVATNSNAEAADRLAEESEKVVNSIQSRRRPTQQAAVKE